MGWVELGSVSLIGVELGSVSLIGWSVGLLAGWVIRRGFLIGTNSKKK